MQDGVQTTMVSYQAKLEALLFASGDAVGVADLSSILGIENAACRQQLEILAEQYQHEDRGIVLLFLEDKVQLATKEHYQPEIQTLLQKKRSGAITPVGMEVLAIIAYNQPVTRGFIEQVRGVNSNQVVNTLLEKGLIEEAGRLDAPGKPLLYRTSDTFLRSFTLSGLDQLPPLDVPEEQESAKEEV